jgi:hypothetical protein
MKLSEKLSEAQFFEGPSTPRFARSDKDAKLCFQRLTATVPTSISVKSPLSPSRATLPVIYSMSLATPPMSDALGNSKGVMSQDLEVSLHCHCNSRAVSGGDIFLRRGNSQRIELGFRIEKERVSKDLYRLLLNDQWIYPFFQISVFSAGISAMTPDPGSFRDFQPARLLSKSLSFLHFPY